MISHNDNHNILQTGVLNQPLKYINEKINQIFPGVTEGNTREILIPEQKKVSVSVWLLLFDVLAKNPTLKVASCYNIQRQQLIQPLVCIHTQITTSVFTSTKKGLDHNNTSETKLAGDSLCTLFGVFVRVV